MSAADIHYVHRIGKMEFFCANSRLATHIHTWFNALYLKTWSPAFLVAKLSPLLTNFHYSAKKFFCLRIVD